MLDKVKIIVAALLVIAGIAAYYLLVDQPQLVRVGVFIAGVIAAIVVASTSEAGQNAVKFMKGADLERRKVVWPTQRETMQMTGVVIVMVVLIGFLLWGMDQLSFWVIYDLILSTDNA